MIRRPPRLNAFEFAVLAGLRAAQLQRGCFPRVLPSDKVAVTALQEVAEGKVVRAVSTPSEPIAEPGHVQVV